MTTTIVYTKWYCGSCDRKAILRIRECDIVDDSRPNSCPHCGEDSLIYDHDLKDYKGPSCYVSKAYILSKYRNDGQIERNANDHPLAQELLDMK
jgi:ribosomal protein S27AE